MVLDVNVSQRYFIIYFLDYCFGLIGGNLENKVDLGEGGSIPYHSVEFILQSNQI